MFLKKAYRLIPVLIVFLAVFLRFFALDRYPPALNFDEVSHAYNAYSLLLTGRDQWGTAFPFPNFRAYGDYPTVLNLYLTVPFVAVFGPTDLAVRLPHALAGVLTCLAGLAAAYYWSRRRCLALITALLLAVSPWTLFPSRVVFQSNWTVLLLTLGLALYLSGRRLWSILIFALSLLAYHNTRIFVPLLLPALVWPDRRQRPLLLAVVLVLILAAGLLLSPQSRARSSWVGIIDSGAVAHLDQSRNQSALPPVLSKLVYNRPVYFVFTAAKNYLGYFTPRFLFLSGGTQYQFSLPGYGVLNSALLPFFYLGVVWLVIRRRWLLLFWLAVSPLPAAVTRDQFAVIRATTMIPAVILTAAAGLIWVSSRLSRPAYGVFWGLFLLWFCSTGYYSAYFSAYPVNYARDWQYGYRQVVSLIRQNYDRYDRVIFTKYYAEPHEYVLWYWPWPPDQYQSDSSLSWDYHADWYWVDRFAKFEFINDWDMANFVAGLDPQEKILIVSSPAAPSPGRNLATVNFPDGSPAFYLKDF